MGVEGLWWFQTTSMQQPDVFEAGGVVLETNRVLGGDSIYCYVGDYEAVGGDIVAQVRVRQWNPSVHAENVFGMQGPVDYMAELRGSRQDNVILGELNPVENPTVKLPLRMVFIEKLPG